MRHDGPVPIAGDKARMRAEVRARRQARTDDERHAAAAALAAHLGRLAPEPTTITLYLSMPTEPGTDALVEAALSAGHVVLLPRITGRDLAWVPFERGTDLERGSLGIREPVGPPVTADRLATVGLMLLPGLSVDRAGRRLGQGGGFYDRVLDDVPLHADGGPMRVIVLFDDEVVDDVPADERDRPVDAALTPSRVVRFREPRTPG